MIRNTVIYSYPTLVYRITKDFGLPTTFALILLYILYSVGMKGVSAHEQYLQDTAYLFKANNVSIERLVNTSEAQTKLLAELLVANEESKEKLNKILDKLP